ncbi:MAG: Mur ligase family protein [Sphaerochaeta sp.]|nr:Mur ligase family protein [Sphaerochaeta sp.]
MHISSFDDVVFFMESFTNLEKQTDHYTTRNYRLDRMIELLRHLGSPERAFRKIHLAGSKGKGSTASYLACALSSLGYKTGLYLSPHLVDYRERFTLAGTFFGEDLLVETGRELQRKLVDFSFCDQWGETHPTTFELFTAYAYLLFKAAGCDWAVIETGLGGRLDATNTIIPEASVLCPIELEHTKILGNTIAQIAAEKSKIIKEGVPVVIGYEEDEALDVFLSEARAQKSKVHLLSDELLSLSSETTREGEAVTYQWIDGRKEELLLAMRGHVQAQNSALALLVLRTLGLYEPHILPNFAKNQIPGRFQQLSSEPNLYVDGAHTHHSLASLLSSFSHLHTGSDNTVIYGALEDKDHTHMVSLVLEHFSTIIISKPGSYKKSDIVMLRALFEQQAAASSKPVHIYLVEDNGEALKQAYALTPKHAAILVCGSFYLAGGVKAAYDEIKEHYESQLA